MRFQSISRTLVVLAFAAGTVAAQNSPPSITSLSPSSITAGSATFYLTVTGTGFQNGAFVLLNGAALPTTFQSSNQLLALVSSNLVSSSGNDLIVVTNPGGIQSNPTYFLVTPPPITISISGLPGGMAGIAYAASLVATGGSPPYTWSVVGGLPAGLVVNPAGTITGTPTASGSYTVTVRVTDSQNGTATKALSLTITGLTITTASALPSGTASQPYTQALSVTGGVAPYTWSASPGIPPGLAINSSSGVISGTPSTTGTFTFAVQVTDANRQVATQNLTVTINPPPLTITTVPPLFNGIVGTPYSQTFSAAGGTKPYVWAINSGGTGGLTLDPNSGTLQGTPQAAGTFTFVVQVSDSAGSRVSSSFSITITPPSLTMVTGASLPAGTVGVNYSQAFSVVGGTPPYSWSLSSGSVPGLSFDPNQVVLAGVPTTPGSFTFTLQARDSGGLTATRSFSITINPATLTITTPGQLPDSVLGAAYSYQIIASGGIPPYIWSANGLPNGLTIDPATGTLSGTLAAAGPYSFAVRVSDSARSSATSQFRINVALPTLPLVSISGLPATADAAQQFSLQVNLASPFPADISGQAILTFSPDVGGGDGTIQFSTGGATANFTIPTGSTAASFSAPFAVQTGTVAGTINISLRLQAGGLDVTPATAPAISAHIDQAAPVIQSATVSRTSNNLSIRIVGYSTAREVTQAGFNFGAATGQTLQVSQLTVAVDTVFGNWFGNSSNNLYGSQFVFTQTFAIQGDPNAVIPQSVSLTNRKGTTTAAVSQ